MEGHARFLPVIHARFLPFDARFFPWDARFLPLNKVLTKYFQSMNKGPNLPKVGCGRQSLSLPIKDLLPKGAV